MLHDPEIGLLYADRTVPLPPEILIPVRPAALARALGAPYMSVVRHVASLVERGFFERTSRGVRLSTAYFLKPEVIESNIASGNHTRQVFSRLAADRFPFGDPDKAYIIGPPATLDFGRN